MNFSESSILNKRENNIEKRFTFQREILFGIIHSRIVTSANTKLNTLFSITVTQNIFITIHNAGGQIMKNKKPVQAPDKGTENYVGRATTTDRYVQRRNTTVIRQKEDLISNIIPVDVGVLSISGTGDVPRSYEAVGRNPNKMRQDLAV